MERAEYEWRQDAKFWLPTGRLRIHRMQEPKVSLISVAPISSAMTVRSFTVSCAVSHLPNGVRSFFKAGIVCPAFLNDNEVDQSRFLTQPGYPEQLPKITRFDSAK